MASTVTGHNHRPWKTMGAAALTSEHPFCSTHRWIYRLSLPLRPCLRSVQPSSAIQRIFHSPDECVPDTGVRHVQIDDPPESADQREWPVPCRAPGLVPRLPVVRPVRPWPDTLLSVLPA